MLSLQQVSCMRGDRTLFNGLSFDLRPGQWAHLKGANGSGKTSLLRMVAGLARPVEGEILWNQQPIQQVRETYHADMVYLGHHEGVKEDLSAFENLQLGMAQDGHTLSDIDALRALHAVGLKGREDLPVRVLSAGQKRRALMSRLVAQRRLLWILDEPFNALDVKGVEWLTQRIVEHVQTGGMVLLTSHQTIPLEGGQVVQL